MLEHFGRRDLYEEILAAIEAVLEEKQVQTPDMGGNATTEEMGDAIIQKLG